MKKYFNMNFNKKIIFNFLTYLFFSIFNKIFQFSGFDEKKFYKKMEYSVFYVNKKNLISKIIYNIKVNFLRFKKIQNFKIFKDIHNEKYFFSTRTNFLKRIHIRTKHLKWHKNLFPLISQSKYIIHLGSSTSFLNSVFSDQFKDKTFFQCDLNKKITKINNKLFSNNDNIKVLELNLLDLPNYIKKNRLNNLLIYTNTTLMYLPYEVISGFINDLSKITNITLAFSEPGSNKIISKLNFNNPLIFKHHYKSLFKENTFHYQKLISNDNFHVVRNY
jgi:hypothetical protein